MSKRHRSHSESIIIETSNNYLHFFKLTKLYKDNDLLSYKIYFEDIEMYQLKNAVVDGQTGHLLRKGSPGEKIKGGLEITYHKDGMVMFKDVSNNFNFIREKHSSFKSLSRPKLFFQIHGLFLRDLLMSDKIDNKPLINLNNYNLKNRVNCDFYIGSFNNEVNIDIPSHSKNLFRDPFWFKLKDVKNNIIIYILFWKPKDNFKRTYFSIPSNKLTVKISKIINTIKSGKTLLMFKDWWLEIKSWIYRKINN